MNIRNRKTYGSSEQNVSLKEGIYNNNNNLSQSSISGSRNNEEERFSSEKTPLTISDQPYSTYLSKSAQISSNVSSPVTTAKSSSGHIGSMRSSYYDQVRQQQQQQQTGESSSWLYQVIQDMLSYVYVSLFNNSTSSSSYPIMDKISTNTSNQYPEVQQFGVDEKLLEKLEEFKRYSLQTYDKNDEKHEKLLMELWNLCHQGKLENRITSQWKSIGFQGTDPATDFRGVGVFGLWNLVFFARNYHQKFSFLLRKNQNSSGSYPFVIAGLNITMLLFDFLGIGGRPKKVTNLAARKKFIEILTKAKGWSAEVWWEHHQSLPERPSTIETLTNSGSFVEDDNIDEIKILDNVFDDDDDDDGDDDETLNSNELHQKSHKRKSKSKKKKKKKKSQQQSPLKAEEGILLDFGEDSSTMSHSNKTKSITQSGTDEDVNQQVDARAHNNGVVWDGFMIEDDKSPISTERNTGANKNGKKGKNRREERKHESSSSFLFEKLYVVAFEIMDAEWYRKKATYFEFPDVLEATKERLGDLVVDRFSSILDVEAYLNKSDNHL